MDRARSGSVRQRVRFAALHLAALIALSLLFTLLYGLHGYSGRDEGFLPALSWRVVSGQLPYADFFYIRPPGSVLLHALPQRRRTPRS